MAEVAKGDDSIDPCMTEHRVAYTRVESCLVTVNSVHWYVGG